MFSQIYLVQTKERVLLKKLFLITLGFAFEVLSNDIQVVFSVRCTTALQQILTKSSRIPSYREHSGKIMSTQPYEQLSDLKLCWHCISKKTSQKLTLKCFFSPFHKHPNSWLYCPLRFNNIGCTIPFAGKFNNIISLYSTLKFIFL